MWECENILQKIVWNEILKNFNYESPQDWEKEEMKKD